MQTPEWIKSKTRFRHFTRRFFLKIYNVIFGKEKLKQAPISFESILILVQDKLGDAVLMIPFLEKLHEKFPDARVDIIASKYNSYIFENLDYIHKIYIFKKNHGQLFKELRRMKYDIFFNPKDHASLTAISITRRVNAEIKVGYKHKNHDRFYNVRLDNKPETHIVEKNAGILNLWEIDFPINIRLPIPDDSVKYIEHLGMIYDDVNYAAINLSPGAAKRKWTVDKWIECCQYIIENDIAESILMLAMPRDVDDAMKIKDAIGDKIIYPIGTRNLYDAAVVISKANFIISPDTSLIHIAALAGTPVIGLYHSDNRNLNLFAPYNIKSQTVISRDNLIANIEVEEVIVGLDELIRA